MSSHEPDYELSHQAQIDYDDILLFTLTTWGISQMEKYEATLHNSLQGVGRHPQSGESRPDIGPEIRSLVIGRHVAFYKVVGKRVLVIRILHERRDVKSGLIT
jgi:toxin ParE1/3/4